MITHYDLFAGIGGFSLAIDRVYGEHNTKHIFVEWDDFCTEVLKKHWPQGEYHKDIRDFVANAGKQKQRGLSHSQGQEGSEDRQYSILTGGFPCQPFSQAGRRKGTEDDRYLWPPMFESVSILQPDWVIAENVAGLVTWNDGLVLETVCADLESEGYEVQPFIIPACATGAPHRRDRVWIVAHNTKDAQRFGRRGRDNGNTPGSERKIQAARSGGDASDSCCKGHKGNEYKTGQGARHNRGTQFAGWEENWTKVATRLCRVDDGLPRRMDRNPRLKALGNAIVPQVAEKIIREIKLIDQI